ncbi:MAG TPA: phosphoribosylanthranilate isomerase [Clostridia bacterium]|jgi:phosphoribosylanthranilate isomerase
MCKIKICGIKTQADIEIVNQYLPDFIGFNFIPSSKRAIDLEQAIRLKAAISPKIKSVGLFQNAEPDEIKRVFEAGIMDLIQLHGEEGQDYIDEVKKLGLPVIKAYKITDSIPEFLDSDYILLDSARGGSGKSFDWRLINFKLDKTFLAGGINIDNIDQAKDLKPFCIDVCSGSETDGKKDKNKIKSLIKAVRNG